jgi:hypothetical protein
VGVASDEFDAQLSDLEVRLERLRSLYEQYFVGIEKIEPAVARKDVDRRFWEMRKVKVRNTAKRFKFQTLIQRYNTLQQYWMKVCRQIENGTYVRHLARAKRRIETVAAGRQTGANLEDAALGADDPSTDEVRAAFSELERSSQPPPSLSRMPHPRPRRSMRPSEPVSSNAPGQRPPPPPLDRSAAAAHSRKRATDTVRPPKTRAGSERPAAPGEVTQVASPRSLQSIAPKAPKSAAVPPPRPSASKADATALSAARIERLVTELERARQQTGGEPIPRSALEKSLRQTEQRLKQKHAGKHVDFRIEIEDGTVRIKPVVTR